jgi:hypothetical protein
MNRKSLWILFFTCFVGINGAVLIYCLCLLFVPEGRGANVHAVQRIGWIYGAALSGGGFGLFAYTLFVGLWRGALRGPNRFISNHVDPDLLRGTVTRNMQPFKYWSEMAKAAFWCVFCFFLCALMVYFAIFGDFRRTGAFPHNGAATIPRTDRLAP